MNYHILPNSVVLNYDGKTLTLHATDHRYEEVIDAIREEASIATEKITSDGQNVLFTTTGTVTGGLVQFYCLWKPLSVDGNVEAV